MNTYTGVQFIYLHNVTFLNAYPDIHTTIAVTIKSITMGINGIEPVLTTLIASMAKLRGLKWAIVLSQPGITSYGIRALDVKKSGIVTIAVKAAKESWSSRYSATKKRAK